MAAARYWRLSSFTARGSAHLELAQLELWGGGAKITASLSCALDPVAGTLANLSDADLNTKGKWLVCPGLSFVFDCTTSQTVDFPRFAGAGLDEFVASCLLEYSSDALAWTTQTAFNRVAYPGAGVLTSTDAGGDPDFGSVVLLLHGDGANASTTFTDSSGTPKTFSAAGNAQISTAQSRFGGASMLFDGTGDYAQTSASSDFAFPADFTIEFWSWKSANTPQGYDVALTTDTVNGSAVNGWFVELSATRGFTFVYAGASVFTYATDPNDSAWHHWAISRSGSTLRAFKDGASVFSGSKTTSFLANGVFGVGGSSVSASYNYKGYIDDLRITKGVGRYTTSFTPPVQAFSNDVGGSGLVESAPALFSTLADIAHSVSAVLPPNFGIYEQGRAFTLTRGELSGRGTVVGTIAVAPSTPVARRVRLYRDIDGRFMGETWSDPVTGVYVFHEVPDAVPYTAISYDHTDMFNVVASDKIFPELL